MRNHHTDPVGGVLDRMEQHARTVRLALLGAAGVEAALLLIALLKMDWGNRTHLLLFIFATLGYTIVGLGLVALGAHVSRVGARVVSALDDDRKRE